MPARIARLLTGPLAVAVCLLALVATLPGDVPVAPVAARPNPVAAASGGGLDNVTFYYGGRTALRPGSDLSSLGHPAIVVTTPKGSQDADAVSAIHSIGAKAYRYVQFYWAPDNADYEGINLHANPSWAFCGTGGRRILGRTTAGGRHRWYFLDANETSLRNHLRSLMEQYKAQGWDGVMFDRGEAATQYAKDIHGKPVWYRKSTCTSNPYRAGARFSDAYVNMLGLAHATGLEAMMNNGKSPFDPVVRMRPNPDSAACRRADWSRCHALSDIWGKLDLVLNETSSRLRDTSWTRTFTGNARSERSARYGHRTVALITTATLGGAANQTRSKVFYAWSRVKLFNLAVGVNTGDGGCGGAEPGAPCNRHGVYPELVDTKFGAPLGSRPVRQSCASGSRIHCLWLRRYSRGVDIINVRGSARKNVRVALGTAGCRYVYDVYHRVPLAGNTCVSALRLNIPAWSGRPLKLSGSPW